jgi:protein-tyrosine phosphatase
MKKLSGGILVVSLALFSGMAIFSFPAAAVESRNQILSDSVGEVLRNNDQLRLVWRDMPASGKVILHWQDVASGRISPLEEDVVAGELKLEDPNPGRRTLFLIERPNSEKPLTISERKLPAGGMDNLRDSGGYLTKDGRSVKWGFLYRGDTPHKVNSDGYRYLSTMNLGYVFDLRNDAEIAKKPDPAFGNVNWIHTQIPDLPPQFKDVSWETNEAIYHFVKTPRAEQFYPETNRFMVWQPETLRSLKTIFDKALTDDRAMIWHCAGGKDRTGVVSAVFLSALGVPNDTIIHDYILTNDYRKAFDQRELAEMSKAFNGDKQAIKGFLAIQQARPEFIRAALDEIRLRYGSVDNYLTRAVGLTQEEIFSLRDRYTE